MSINDTVFVVCLHIYRVWIVCTVFWVPVMYFSCMFHPVTSFTAVFCNSDSYAFACSFHCVWLVFGVWLHRGCGDLWTFRQTLQLPFQGACIYRSCSGVCVSGSPIELLYSHTHFVLPDLYEATPVNQFTLKMATARLPHFCTWLNPEADQIHGVLWCFYSCPFTYCLLHKIVYIQNGFLYLLSFHWRTGFWMCH